VEIVVLVAGLTAGIIALAGRIPEARRVKRELARTHIQLIELVDEGKVAAVHGTVALVEPKAYILAPWTQQHCVYWRVVFDEVGVGGDFHELGRTEGGIPFLLRSEHGTARVVPDRPRVALHGNAFMRPVQLAEQLYVHARPEKLKRPNYPTSWIRMTMYTLSAGTEVTVRGWCTREPDPEAAGAVSGYREQLPTRPVISGTRRAKLLIG
jgi:hypothetical protein